MERQTQYENFCKIYGLPEVKLIEKLYNIDELIAFLPPSPSENEKKTLQSLIGVTQESGYWDYQLSNNTFELIMQWREATGNFGENPLQHGSA